MVNYDKPKEHSALEAKTEALKIAFSPIVFQATYALLKLGILKLVSQHAKEGITVEEIADQLTLSVYGVQVLLNIGLSARILWLENDCYFLDKTGHFVLCDTMVHVNLDFIQDVCYQGLFYLLDSIKTGKPEGLKVFGDWPTIYPALNSLPPKAQESWFQFDHFYSDHAFPEALPIVFSQPVSTLFDIGGNTGKWTQACLDYDSNVKVTIVDLPQQLKSALANIEKKGLAHRVNSIAIDWLQPSTHLPGGADVIWMSQFLDCFSEAEILAILKHVARCMNSNTRLYILETYWDRQTYEAAAFSINCTSAYFTCMANGNSRMYHSKHLIALLHQAGLYIDEDIDHIGSTHTLFGCKKKSINVLHTKKETTAQL